MSTQEQINVTLTNETFEKLQILAERLGTTQQLLVLKTLKELLYDLEPVNS